MNLHYHFYFSTHTVGSKGYKVQGMKMKKIKKIKIGARKRQDEKIYAKNAGSCSGQNNSGQTFIDDKKECSQWLFFQVFLYFLLKKNSSFSVSFSLPL